ncbi:transglutaminase family protein [Chloroflexota bacterium]
MNKANYLLKSITHYNNCRLFVCSILILFAISACQQLSSDQEPSSPIVLSTHQYTVKQMLTLHNRGTGQPEKQNLWVALIQDMPPYQRVNSQKISPDNYRLVIDEYGNEYAEFDFSNHPAGTEISVEIEYRVAVNELSYELDGCEGDSPQEFTNPELRVESANPQIVAISEKLSLETENACEQARAFYDYVADELVYSYNRNDWGAQAALGAMGADCTEYSSLMMALSRAAEIPARYYEGLLYLEGKTAGLAQTEHAWLDMYLPGIGWVAADPTLGRSSLHRETFYAHYTPEHIIVTMGRNPSTLRGSSYWSHLYWPGDSTEIQVKAQDWQITLVE